MKLTLHIIPMCPQWASNHRCSQMISLITRTAAVSFKRSSTGKNNFNGSLSYASCAPVDHSLLGCVFHVNMVCASCRHLSSEALWVKISPCLLMLGSRVAPSVCWLHVCTTPCPGGRSLKPLIQNLSCVRDHQGQRRRQKQSEGFEAKHQCLLC